jgi:hypothetical protein
LKPSAEWPAGHEARLRGLGFDPCRVFSRVFNRALPLCMRPDVGTMGR